MNEYVFVDEWDVDAPREAVFDVLADPMTYPAWWQPVYLEATREGDVTHHLFRGRLPYRLRVRSQVVRRERPVELEAKVEGDLTGRGVWTLTPKDGLAHVRFDWRVSADRPFLRVLTPVLRPLFRWNHNWAIKRAQLGLEPYVRRSSGLA